MVHTSTTQLINPGSAISAPVTEGSSHVSLAGALARGGITVWGGGAKWITDARLTTYVTWRIENWEVHLEMEYHMVRPCGGECRIE